MKNLSYDSQNFQELSQIDLTNLNGGGILKWIVENLIWEASISLLTSSPGREGPLPEPKMSGGYYVMPSDNA